MFAQRRYLCMVYRAAIYHVMGREKRERERFIQYELLNQTQPRLTCDLSTPRRGGWRRRTDATDDRAGRFVIIRACGANQPPSPEGEVFGHDSAGIPWPAEGGRSWPVKVRGAGVGAQSTALELFHSIPAHPSSSHPIPNFSHVNYVERSLAT